MKKIVSKRIRVTKTGKIMRRAMRTGAGSRKSRKLKRNKRGSFVIARSDIKNITRELFKKKT